MSSKYLQQPTFFNGISSAVTLQAEKVTRLGTLLSPARQAISSKFVSSILSPKAGSEVK